MAQPALRLGLASVRTVGDDLAEAIVAERDAHGPYASMEDLARRVPMGRDTFEALATAGAFACLDDGTGRPLDRRRALWAAGAVAQGGVDKLAGMVTGVEAPQLPGLTDRETAGADLWATGVAPDGHPTRFIRADLDRLGVVTSTGLAAVEDGSRVLVGGVVTHRQRPATAGGHHLPQPRGRDRPGQRDRARRAVGPATAGWPAPRRRCWCAVASSGPRASPTSSPTSSSPFPSPPACPPPATSAERQPRRRASTAPGRP